MSKRTEKIILEVLERVSNVIGNRYRIDPTQLMDLIKDITDSLHCTYVLTKGKRKANERVTYVMSLFVHTTNRRVLDRKFCSKQKKIPQYISQTRN